MFKLITTSTFDKQLRKFTHQHPELRKNLAELFKKLEADPFHPSLRLHPLKGILRGMHAVSVTYSYRITLIIRLSPSEITLLDIGSHDQLYR